LRKKYPWIIVFSHHPFYCSNVSKEGDCSAENKEYRDLYEDIFMEYGVDLGLQAH